MDAKQKVNTNVLIQPCSVAAVYSPKEKAQANTMNINSQYVICVLSRSKSCQLLDFGRRMMSFAYLRGRVQKQIVVRRS